MALATRCPACITVFRISTAQAAAKGGMVRCGLCANVFNSLDALVRVEDLEVIEEVEVPLDNEVEPAETPYGPADDASDHGFSALPPERSSPVTTALDDSPRTVISEWWLPDPRGPATPAAPPMPLRAPKATTQPASSADLRSDAGQVLSGRRTDFEKLPGMGMGIGAGSGYLRPDAPVDTRRRLMGWGFAAMSLLALLVALGQAAYLWRDEVAARWPVSRPWLAAACAPLRCKVGYPVHVDAVTIESTSVQTNGPTSNVYVLSALLRNRDAVDVRYPYLNLVLTDLQDRPILRRALRPEDYLPTGRSAASPVAPAFPADSELPVRVTFELNDLRFAGYRLEKFYP